MSEFIRVEIDMDKCVGVKECGQCIIVCPVTIFRGQDNHPSIVVENEDECTLCELCLKICEPNAISLRKLYES